MDSGQSPRTFSLRDTGLTVASEADDIRGSRVVDRDGKNLGRVSDFVLREHQEGIAYLDVTNGGFLGFRRHHSLIPVASISAIDGAKIVIDPAHPRDTLFQPELIPNEAAWLTRVGRRGKTPPLYLHQKSAGGTAQTGPRL